MTKSKKWLLVVFVAILFSAISVFLISPYLAFATEADEVSFDDKYTVGEIVALPSANVNVEGNSVKAETIVHYPDGSAIKTDKAELTTAGKYVVEYKATKGSQTVSVEKTFIAEKPIFEVSSAKSQVTYGKDSSGYGIEGEGLNVSLNNGDKLVCNQIIDFNNTDRFIRMYFTPEFKGTREVQGVYYKLTDIYDENNYILVDVHSRPYVGSTYVYQTAYALASANDGTPVGWDYSVNRLRVNDPFGTAAFLSMYANGLKEPKEEFLDIFYDMSEKTILLGSWKATYVVCDFDDLNFVSKIWEGFTTGEARLTIEPYGFTSSTCHFFVKEVGGRMIDGKISDDDAPEITVLNPYESGDLPEGAEGWYYPVFDAVAFDKEAGYLEYQAKAYYGYGGGEENYTEIAIENGRVKTEKAGNYAIIYTARDYFGNEGKSVLKFRVSPSATEMEISVENQRTQGKTGELITFGDHAVSGGKGFISSRVSVFKGNQEIETVKNGFIPQSQGTYTVRYDVEDVTGRTASLTYEVEISLNPDVVIITDYTMPKVLVKDKIFEFPTIIVKDYVNNKSEEAAFSVTGGSADGKKVTCSSSEVTYTYSYNGEVVLGGKIPVIDGKNDDGEVAYGNYFNAEGGNLSLSSEGVSFAASGVNASVEFIKPVIYNSFSANLKIPAGGADYEYLDIIFTDVTDGSNSLTLSVYNDRSKSGSVLLVNGANTGLKFSIGGFYGGAQFYVEAKAGIFSDGQNIKAYDISNVFDADKVFVKFALRGANGNASLIISNLCGQSLTATRDRISPMIKVKGSLPDQVSNGYKLDLPAMIAEDVLDTYSTATVTVSYRAVGESSFKKVYEADAFKENQYTVNGFGTYRVNYTAKDSLGNYANSARNYTVMVYDDIKAEFAVSGVKDTVKVGSVGVYTVDGIKYAPEGERAKFFVVNAEGKIIPVAVFEQTDGFTFKYKFEVKGRYKLRFTLAGEGGNLTMKEYTVYCEE